jgi:hypothetical protein
LRSLPNTPCILISLWKDSRGFVAVHAIVGGVNIDLKAIAYHEAGHAVIGHLFKLPFKLVTIEPKGPETGFVEFRDGECKEVIGDPGYGGRVEFETEETIISIMAMDADSLDANPEAISYVRGAVLSAMAGSIAQEIGAPGSVQPGWAKRIGRVRTLC